MLEFVPLITSTKMCIRDRIGLIREYELSPSYFQFEITETVATRYSEDLYRAVTEFTQAGIGLCLDDFGSGYANLNTVLQLPFSEIKLDKSLLSGICDTPKIASFYRSIVSVLQDIDVYKRQGRCGER